LLVAESRTPGAGELLRNQHRPAPVVASGGGGMPRGGGGRGGARGGGGSAGGAGARPTSAAAARRRAAAVGGGGGGGGGGAAPTATALLALSADGFRVRKRAGSRRAEVPARGGHGAHGAAKAWRAHGLGPFTRRRGTTSTYLTATRACRHDGAARVMRISFSAHNEKSLRECS